MSPAEAASRSRHLKKPAAILQSSLRHHEAADWGRGPCGGSSLYI
ncbi:MAG: hypothetical protein ACK56I_11885 [bacterium]